MKNGLAERMRGWTAGLVLLAAALAAPAVSAQGIERVDPNAAIDADLEPGWQGGSAGAEAKPTYEAAHGELPAAGSNPLPVDSGPQAGPPAPAPASTDIPVSVAATRVDPSTTYAEDDLIGAAEGVFGKGAEGLARLIEDVLSKQGEPNGYIVGREGGGAFVLGVRYGSGTLFHKVEGQRPVYWTGPSIGLDAGANAGNTFVLIYNLHDTEELYERYPAGETGAYLVGGFNASYLRKGNVVLIPVRVGAGLRLGINAGYMRFSKKHRWLPF